MIKGELKGGSKRVKGGFSQNKLVPASRVFPLKGKIFLVSETLFCGSGKSAGEVWEIDGTTGINPGKPR